MKTKFILYVVIVIHSIFNQANFKAQCAPVEFVTNGSFTNDASDWTLENGWVRSGHRIINPEANVTARLFQQVKNLNKITYGVIPLTFTIGAQDDNHIGGNTSKLEILLNGVVHATFNNSLTRNATNVTLALGSGVSGDFIPFGTSGVIGYVERTVTIWIPYTGPSEANLVFRKSGGLDDWSIDNVSINPSICDTDEDGIPDWLDLDDDNDGILDTNECVYTNQKIVEWHADNSSGFDATIINSNVVASDGTLPVTHGSGISLLSLNFSSYSIRGLSDSSTTLSEAMVENDYLQYQFRTKDWNTSTLNKTLYKHDKTSVYYQNVGIPYKFAVVLSTDNFVTQKILLKDINSVSAVGRLVYDHLEIDLQPNTEYKVRIYFYGLQSDNFIVFDNYTPWVSSYCDTDGDGIPDYLDLDSDNDGCSDAIEGGNDFKDSVLSDASGNLVVQNPHRNFGINVDQNGIPIQVGENGQSVGASRNSAIQDGCFCYKEGVKSEDSFPTLHGITSFGRAGELDSQWPKARNSAWTVLESKTKGFVPNRLTTTQISAIPAANLIIGMMVYNTTINCMMINIDGTSDGWKCFNYPACP